MAVARVDVSVSHGAGPIVCRNGEGLMAWACDSRR